MSEADDRLDDALARRPSGDGRADGELAPYRDTLAALETLRPVPARDPAAAAAAKRTFLESARQMAPGVSAGSGERPRRGTFMWRKEHSPMTAIVSTILALALAFGGVGATAYAAQDSLPAEPLYGVKLLGEQVRLALSQGPQSDLGLLVGFVNERIREMTALVNQGQEVPAQVHARLQEQLQLALQYAAQLGDADMAGALAQIRTMAENQVRSLEQLRLHASVQADAALRQAEQTMTQARTMAEDGLEDPLTFRLRLGVSRPEDAPEQPEMTPSEGTCDNCPPEPGGEGPNGPGQQGNGQGGPP